jgi:hypothetical protein
MTVYVVFGATGNPVPVINAPAPPPPPQAEVEKETPPPPPPPTTRYSIIDISPGTVKEPELLKEIELKFEVTNLLGLINP